MASSIDTYGELKAQIAGWMNRTDLTAMMDTFVQLAESSFNRNLRVPEMVKTNDAFSVSAKRTALPTDYLEMLAGRISIGGQWRDLDIETVREQTLLRGSVSGTPCTFAIVGTNLEVSPPPDGSYTLGLDYYGTISTITTGDSGTNSVLVAHPDLYLFRSLMNAATYMRDANRLASYSAAYQGIRGDIKTAMKKSKQSTAMAVKVA